MVLIDSWILGSYLNEITRQIHPAEKTIYSQVKKYVTNGSIHIIIYHILFNAITT